MYKNIALIISGIVFSLISLGHLIRILFGTVIMIAGDVVPMSVSYVAFIISLLLALWMFTATKIK